MLLGAHVPAAGGCYRAYGWADNWQCTAMQVFTKSPSQWASRALTSEDIAQFVAAGASSKVKVVTAHDAYLINLASPDAGLLQKSRRAFRDELERCEQLGIPYLVTHMGSHMGVGEDAGLRLLAESLDCIHAELPGYRVQVLIEATAGQGTNLGYRFEHLQQTLDAVSDSDRLGVCLDTCHLFAAGYDLRDARAYRRTMRAFNKLVGLDRLRCFHLNDSKFPLGSRRDRHERVGRGTIGPEAFRLILRDRRLARVPKIIETPELTTRGGDDLNYLRRLAQRPASEPRPSSSRK